MTYSVLLPGMFTPGHWAATRIYHFHQADAVIADRHCGLGSLEDTYQHTRDQLGTIVGAHGRVKLKTHSLGGRIGAMIGLRHPELVERVDAISSPFDGIDVIPEPILTLLATVPGIRELICDRDRIADFQSQVARDWSPAVSLRLVAVAWDMLVSPRRSAWALDPPAGCDVSRYWVGPVLPHHLPAGVRYVHALGNIGHLSGALNGRLSALD